MLQSGRTISLQTGGFVLLLVVLGAVVSVYNAGVDAGLNVAFQQAVQNGQSVPVGPYGYGPYWHGGIGFFGMFFWIIGFFLIIGLIRAAFGFGRGGRAGWAKSGHGPGGYSGGGYSGRGEVIADMHREASATDWPT